MKKFSMLAFVLGLFLTAGNAMAATSAPKGGLHDSAWLANDNVLSKTVGQPNSGTALGSVIVWTNAGMPADAANWRECNGQSLAGTAVCKRIGICTAPDYRGLFLRGYGRNAETGMSSGALGQFQKDGVYVNPDDVTARITNLKVENSVYSSMASNHKTRAIVPEKENFSGDYIWRGVHGSIKGNIEIKSKEKETRPINKAVRYLIKVN